MKKIKKIFIYGFLTAVVAVVINHGAVRSFMANAQTIGDLNQEIESKKNNIDNLEKQLDIYQKKIRETRNEAVSLANQLSILDDELEKNQIDIEITEEQIQKTNLEIQRISLAIDEQIKEVEKQKKRLGEYLRTIYQNDEITYLEVLVLNDSFSDFFDHYQYLETIQSDLRSSLQDLKSLKEELDLQKTTLEEKREREIGLKEELEIKKTELQAVSNEKEVVLTETRRSESRFQSYVNQLKREQTAINNEIVSLERKIREELERREKEERFNEFGPLRLQWPVPSRTVTAYFHDPDYPYRHIFEHPAIDIRASQSTPIEAAEAGYVGQVKNGGLGYSYIMLIHAEGISTVYGHVSAIYVSQDQYVQKGDIIGASGGKPGTSGAGNLTTGAHLHFEVRKNGIPVNPLDYLP